MSKKSKENAANSSGAMGPSPANGGKKSKSKDSKSKDKVDNSADVVSAATGKRGAGSTIPPCEFPNDDLDFEVRLREANLLVHFLSELQARIATVRAELEADGLLAQQMLSASHEELTRAAQELDTLHLRLEESRDQARQELSATDEELTQAARELESLHLRLEESRNAAQQDLASAVRELRSAEQDLRATRGHVDEIRSADQRHDLTLASPVAQSPEPAVPNPPTMPVPDDESEGDTEAKDDGRSTNRLRSVASGGAILWGGTVAFGVSTAVLLAILSRHHSVSFAALSALLGLSFVMALIPSGVQLRAAALVADGFAVPRMPARFLAMVTAVGFALSPVLGLILRVPAIAVGLIVVQLVVALPLAARCGGLIGVHRFEALGVNMVIESAVRVGLGALGGLTLGIPGLAGGLAMGTIVALVALPAGPPDSDAVERPMTSLFNASITLVLLGFFVQMDVLMAPSGLTHSGATYYDLAALPSKGVYIVLLAAGPMVFPFVRRNASPKLILLAAGGTLLFGLLVTAMLLPLRHLIGILLDQATPSLLLMAVLGSAMAAAGTTAVLLNAGVARGVARPWPPLVLGMIAIAAVWASRPSATTFALTVLGAQVGTMVLSAYVTTKGRRGAVAANSRSLTIDEPATSPPEASGHDEIVSLNRSHVTGITGSEDVRHPRVVAWRHPSALSRSLADRPFRRGDRERDHRGGRHTEAG